MIPHTEHFIVNENVEEFMEKHGISVDVWNGGII
jgi:hypothetical protein